MSQGRKEVRKDGKIYRKGGKAGAIAVAVTVTKCLSNVRIISRMITRSFLAEKIYNTNHERISNATTVTYIIKVRINRRVSLERISL